MSDAEWDDDDFQPPGTKIKDKWEGEDEDDSVKENWDDDDEEENKAKSVVVKKKKKKLADVIAEKEQKALEDRLRRQKLREEEAKRMTPAEKLAEKRRMQKIQEDSDLILASDMLGGDDDDDEDSDCFDDIEFDDQESLSQFRDMLIKKVRSTEKLEKKAYYYEFVESLVRGLCANMEQDDVKRISTSVNTLYNEKVKANKPKGKKKGAGKAKLNVGQGMIADTSGINDDYVDYEDFI